MGTAAVVLIVLVVAASALWLGWQYTRARNEAREAERLRQEGLRAEKERQREQERIRLTAEARIAYPLLERTRASLNPIEYLARSEAAVWQSDNQQAFTYANRNELADYLPEDEAWNYRTWCGELRDLPRTVEKLNKQFIARRVADDKEAFDTVEKHPLTEAQRQAIVTNEDTTLVIAGAGTGKTSTIVGKVDYLIRHSLANPERILVLTYNRKASEQLKGERLLDIPGGDHVHVSTFHALGLKVISEAQGIKPSLSPLAEQERVLKTFIRDQLQGMLQRSATHHLLVGLLSRHLDEGRRHPGTSAKTGDEHIRDEKALGLRAIDGTRLKSREEVQIANWLTLNGIQWEYERPYPFSIADQAHRQYQPDFYLPEYDHYIEHFGIDEYGRTAPQISDAKYHRSMQWKRAIHRRYGTRLVETYSYFKRHGGLVENLELLLRGHGVEPRLLSAPEIEAIVAKTNRPFSDLVNLVSQFLTVFKSNGANRERVQARARSARDHVFLGLFWDIYDAYCAELSADNHVDFNDMINLARHHIRSGRYASRYAYILVDEFQDISENRLGLLQDLRAMTPHGRLFVVGDDWQSIYRFTGSDINIITDLEQQVGATQRVDLGVAFRYSQELLDATSTFVMKNPRQLKKELRAFDGNAGETPIVIVYEHQFQALQPTHAFQSIVDDIVVHASGKPSTVYILGRYHSNKPKFFDDIAKIGRRYNITFEFSTAHSAKGKEADYIVVVGLEAGEYGFPANIADDPVMDLVLAKEEPFPYAEERRLFYVAMTRARRRVYLVTPQDNTSPFIQDELLNRTYRFWVDQIGEISERHRCPKCQGNTIRQRDGKCGMFWACTHYPLCDGKLDTCPWCRTGGMAGPDGRIETYKCTDCGREAEPCPRCKRGYLCEKSGKYGPFLGCSQWKQDGTGCTFTRNLAQGSLSTA